jgi:hypothetical protein
MQPGPNPVSDGPRPHQVAGLPRATRQAPAGRVLSQARGTTRLSVVDTWRIKLRTQVPQSGERTVR